MTKSRDIKIINAWICQISGGKIIPVFGDVHISNGIIKDIIIRNPEEYNFESAQIIENVIDAGGRVLTVPSINFHDHFYSRLAKGLPFKGPMNNFTNILENLWWKLDNILDLGMIRASAQMAVLESIRNGVTYIFDHHSSPLASKGSLKEISGIMNEIGFRGVLCFETTDRNGNALAQNGIEENISYIKNNTDGNVKGMLGLHASFTLNENTLMDAAKVLEKYETGIHVHLCEDVSDKEISLKEFNKSPAERLEQCGILNNKSILAHGIYLNENEYQIIEKYGCAVVYNPDSNMNNSVGLPSFDKVPSAIPVLCGTDGMSSNPNRTIKQLFLLGRHQGMSFDSAFGWIKKIFFDQLSFVKKYFPDFPFLKIGDRADMVVWDYITPTPFTENNFWGHYLYGIVERPANSVIQDGKILMNNFRITFNESSYNQNIFNHGKKLYNKIEKLNSR